MKKRIFVIDDSKFIRKQIREIAEKSGEYIVIGEADDGENALIKLEEIKPDIITLDLTMPKIDGLEFLKKFKSLKNQKAYVVVITAIGHDYSLIKAIEAGAVDFIKKPFKSDELVKVLGGLSALF